MAEINRKSKDVCVNNLRDLFGSVLHIDIIRAVASQCDFDGKFKFVTYYWRQVYSLSHRTWV